MSDFEIDPALAHLYEDDFADDVELPTRTTTLDELAADSIEVEVLTDHDVDELALLVEGLHARGASSDEELAELGLGAFTTVDGEEIFDLNDNGLRVTRRMAQRAGLTPRGAR